MGKLKQLLLMSLLAVSTVFATITVSNAATNWQSWEINYGGQGDYGLGDCSDKQEITDISYGKGCFRKTGDHFIVRDTARDGYDAGIRWWHETTERRGVCRGNGGHFLNPGSTFDRSCNKNFLENTKIRYAMVRNKPKDRDPNKNAGWVDQSTPIDRMTS